MRRSLVPAAALLATLVATVRAQDRALTAFASGGGYTPMVDLTSPAGVDFKTGFHAGGGLTLEIHRLVGLRGDVTFVQTRRRGTAADTDWLKVFMGADVVFRIPVGPVRPYLSAGGGVVTLDEDVADAVLSSRRAGRFGVGATYDLSGQVSLFVQGLAWVYSWDKTKYPTYVQTQFDAIYTLGLSYRIPL